MKRYCRNYKNTTIDFESLADGKFVIMFAIKIDNLSKGAKTLNLPY